MEMTVQEIIWCVFTEAEPRFLHNRHVKTLGNDLFLGIRIQKELLLSSNVCNLI